MGVSRSGSGSAWSASSQLPAIDFEPVSLIAARSAANQLPSHVAARIEHSPHGWEPLRRRCAPADLALENATLRWLAHFPPPLRPDATARQYPRVANRLARAWGTPIERWGEFDELLFGYRPKRRGFPIIVRTELERLYKAARRAAARSNEPNQPTKSVDEMLGMVRAKPAKA